MDMMLTTVDNPFNPFTHYDEWWGWDNLHGYHCPEMLAQNAEISDDISDADQDDLIAQAMREIVMNDPTMTYTIVFKDVDEAIQEIENKYGENNINDEIDGI